MQYHFGRKLKFSSKEHDIKTTNKKIKNFKPVTTLGDKSL